MPSPGSDSMPATVTASGSRLGIEAQASSSATIASSRPARTNIDHGCTFRSGGLALLPRAS